MGVGEIVLVVMDGIDASAQEEINIGEKEVYEGSALTFRPRTHHLSSHRR